VRSGSQGKVLLLLRCGKHNADTWGLPGGNAETGDLDLLATARREGTEELGHLPQYDVQAEILTKRGKRKQKHYTVFMATVSPLAQQHYYPNLNTAEHSSWKWFSWKEVQQQLPLGKLHPVVEILLKEHRPAVEAVVLAPHGG